MRKLIIYALLLLPLASNAQWISGGTPQTILSGNKQLRFNFGTNGFVYGYTKAQVDSAITAASGGGVTSFNGRTGVVLPLSGDYSSFYPLLNGTGATGTWGINITGNAGTVTNGVYTTTFNGLGDARYPQLTGSYANPSWITSLAYAKLTGAPSSLPPSGTAGGDLTGTYPNPTVNTINSITKSYYDPTSSIQTQLNARELLSNKVTTLDNSTTHYPSTSAVTAAINNHLVKFNRVVYASQNSVPMDVNLTTRTGTNSLPRIQTIIDSLTALSGASKLILDGNVLIQNPGINLKSNVTIELIGTAQLADQSNCAIVNAGMTGNGISVTNIAVTGGTWQANGYRQNFYLNADSTGTYPEAVRGMLFGNVDGLTISNLTLKNARTFAIVVGQSKNLIVQNVNTLWDVPATGPYQYNHDGLHINGMSNFYVTNFRSNGDDDVIALNTNEFIGVLNPARYGTTGGAITNGYLENIYCDAANNFLRLYGITANPGSTVIDNVFFHNVFGSLNDEGVFTNVSTNGRIGIDGYHLTGNTQIGNVNPLGATSLWLNDIDPGTSVNLGTITNSNGNYFNHPSTGSWSSNVVPSIVAGILTNRNLYNDGTAIGLNTSTPSTVGGTEADANAKSFVATPDLTTTNNNYGGFTGVANNGGQNVVTGFYNSFDFAMTNGYRYRGGMNFYNLSGGTASKRGSGINFLVRPDNSTTPVIGLNVTPSLTKAIAGLSQNNVLSAMLRANGSGDLVAATGGPGGDYEFPLTFTNGLSRSTNTISPTYGTLANTFAQGNDSRINNGQTAFSWGNPAGVYLTIANPTHTGLFTSPQSNIAKLNIGATATSNNKSFGSGVDGTFVGIGGVLAGNTTSSNAILGANWYYTATGDTYINSAAAGLVLVNGTGLTYYNAPSGTAGTAMTLASRFAVDVNGNASANSFNVVASADLTGQTTGTNVVTYTTSGIHSYEISCYVDVTAFTSGNLSARILYTNENGVSQTVGLYPMGSTTATIATLGSTSFPVVGEIRAASGTTITVQTNSVSPSYTYNAGGTIRLIR